MFKDLTRILAWCTMSVSILMDADGILQGDESDTDGEAENLQLKQKAEDN